ncbi:hypothetical protein D3C81_908080 [compost metagenome]
MHIILVDPANFQRSDPHIFTDPVILVDDVIADLQLGIALDPFGIVHALADTARFTLFLGEHLAFRNDDKMCGRQFKTGLQVALQQRWLINPVILQHPPHAIHAFLRAGQHDDVGAAFFPTLHLRLQDVHLPMKILHRPRYEVHDVLRLRMRHLAQEQRHKQRLERTVVDQMIHVHRQRQIGKTLPVLEQVQIPLRFIAFELLGCLQEPRRFVEQKQRILRHVVV